MAAKKFYAVAKGRKPGIYDNWPDTQAQVMSFAGAVYKGFATRREAEIWLRNPSYGPATARKAAPAKKTTAANHASHHDTDPKAGEITIYSDGGARYNPGPGGYGVVIIANGEQREISAGFKHTTNNRMELMGCIVALRAIGRCTQPVTLYTDSSYVVNGISKGWAKNWRQRGWLKADKQPAINPDLWGELLALTEKLDITFRWVKGHAGHPLNERCDELAVAAARGDNLPEDSGYQGNGQP
ncbi:MAG: ribonuclease HI [Desulfobulbaceae bacterium]|nr:ribonuclease HI [Desulfobulbaceae bacterium]